MGHSMLKLRRAVGRLNFNMELPFTIQTESDGILISILGFRLTDMGNSMLKLRRTVGWNPNIDTPPAMVPTNVY